ncbi:MAG: ATP-binding protein [Methanomassiliicoccus sp.]|nr:ATP-binding protein [Methanomassiliicoccus sp.]
MGLQSGEGNEAIGRLWSNVAEDEKCRLLYSNTGQALAILELVRDERGDVVDIILVDANTVWERNAHQDLKMVIGRGMKASSLYNDRDLVDAIERVERTGEREIMEHQVPRFDRYFESCIFRIGPDRIGTLSRDITENKRAEQRLESELRDTRLLRNLSMRLMIEDDARTSYQEIMDTAVVLAKADMGTMQIHENGSLTVVAYHGFQKTFLDHFADATGIASSCGHAVQRYGRVIVPDVENSPLFAGTASLKVLQNAGVRSVQSTPLIGREGKLLGVLSTHWTKLYDPSEQDLWRIDLVARQAADIIERRKHEEELKRSNSELQQFAYTASHDLKEPLRMVSSYLGLLEKKYEDKLDDNGVEYLRYAVEGAVRMSSIIDDLLTYSRIGTSGTPMIPVDMNDVLATAFGDLRVAIRESGAQITNVELPTVTADRSQIVLLLENLVANAIKFRGDYKPYIEITAVTFDNEYVFSVKDNGIGIDPKYADKLFKMFQRLHTKEEYPGTGIGLAICKKIVERHGGRIWFESEPGKGTTFYFTIPT